MMKALMTVGILGWVLASSASAAVYQLGLDGAGGEGLLGSNKVPQLLSGTGSGGVTGGGIFLNDVTNVLTLNIGWGESLGFTNLTGPVVTAHIHGLTAAPAAGYFQNAAAIFTLHELPGWNGAADGGGFSGDIVLPPSVTSAILTEGTYINVHTATHSSGEIRGQLVIIPEPSVLAMGLSGLLLLARRRR